MSAIAPVTCGAAMLVPVLSTYSVQQESGQQSQQFPRRFAASAFAAVMFRPGAAMFGFGFAPAFRATGPRDDDGSMSVEGHRSQQPLRDRWLATVIACAAVPGDSTVE